MLRKIMCSFILMAFLLCVGLVNVNAATNTKTNTEYGTITVNEEVVDGEITQEYTITSSKGKYIAFRIVPGLNVDKDSVGIVVNSTNFKQVGEQKVNSDGSRTIILEYTSGTKVSSAVKIFTVQASQEETGKDCNLSYEPIILSCKAENGKYFIDSGTEVSKEEYEKVCSSTTLSPKDEPSTGIPVPYLAVMGGLFALAGLAFVSKKKKKMYRI